jgi:hypothetical protein
MLSTVYRIIHVLMPRQNLVGYQPFLISVISSFIKKFLAPPRLFVFPVYKHDRQVTTNYDFVCLLALLS